MSSEQDMGPDGKMHSHSSEHGATVSCQDGRCQHIACEGGKCKQTMIDEKTGVTISDEQMMKEDMEAQEKAANGE